MVGEHPTQTTLPGDDLNRLGASHQAGERDVQRLTTAAAPHAKGPKGEDGAS